MTERKIWAYMIAAVVGTIIGLFLAGILIWLTSPAYSAVLPRADTPLTATETAKEARRPAGQCIQVQTIRRFLVRPGGKWVPLTGEISMLVPCS